MKKIIIGIFVALLLVGCSSDLMEDSYEARASEATNKKQESSNEKARLSVVSNQKDNYGVKYQIIRDNKTNKEYLVVHQYQEGLDVIPLDDSTSQTENK